MFESGASMDEEAEFKKSLINFVSKAISKKEQTRFLDNLNEELNNVKQESRLKIYQTEEEMKESNYLKNVFLNQLVTLQAKLENN